MGIGESTPERLSGTEQFHKDGRILNAPLLGFWQWSASDLVSNATRGLLAEYIVALATDGVPHGVRREWGAYDLDLEDGTKVEVKSAAYLQTWKQSRPSTIIFNVSKRRWWDANTGATAQTPERPADVYVFALLKHLDRATLDPLDVAQWDFFVLPTRILDERTRSQTSITLGSLQALTEAVAFAELAAAIRAASIAQNSA